MDRAWNVLYGVFAVRQNMVTPSQLADAAAAWMAHAEDRDLSEWLTGAMSDDDSARVTRLVNDAVAANHGDADAALALIAKDDPVFECYRGTVVLAGPREREDGRPPLDVLDPAAVLAVTEEPDRYTHLSEYARGGMGRVLLVEDRYLDRKIAWKELLVGRDALASADPASKRLSRSLVSRFVQEARITGQLEHPAIVPVYELGRQADGTLYYTMKLVRGQTLQAAIRACGTLRERLKLLAHFVDVCQALAYAHSRGVIHRDIKPANVMVGEFGETVVLDWGLAATTGDTPDTSPERPRKHLESQTPSNEMPSWRTEYGSALGTPTYMPPEQAQGRLEAIDARSDVYSLGAVLYELLTGKPPFFDVHGKDILQRVIEADPVPVRRIAEEAPPELVAICEHAMRKSPDQRYATAKELADDVTRFQSGALVQAYEYGFWTYLRRHMAKHKAVVAVSAVALVALVALSSFYGARIVSANRALRAANEVAIVGLLESIADAQRNFQRAAYQDHDDDGEGDYGTLMQLSMADPSGILSRYVEAFETGSHLGYSLHLEVMPGAGSQLPGFTCLATPQEASGGMDAFVIDESGEVRIATEHERRTREITGVRTVKFLHYLGPPLASEMTVLAEEFHRERTAFRIAPISLTPDAFTGNVANTLQRNPSPDLITYWPGARTNALVMDGLLLPMEDVWRKTGLVDRVSTDVRAASSYPNAAYLLPYVQNYFIFYYNVEIFERHGLRAPTTWAELLETCEVLKGAGVVATSIAAGDHFPFYFWFDYLLLRTAGVAYRNALARGEARFTDPEVEHVFALLAGMFQSGLVAPDSADTVVSESFDALRSGRVAVLLAGTWTGSQLEAQGWKAGHDFGMFPFPSMDGKPSTIVGNLDAIALSARAGYPHAARAFLERLATPEAQLRLSQAGGGLPIEEHRDTERLSELQRQVEDCVDEAPQWLLAFDLEVSHPHTLNAFADGVTRFTRAPEMYREVLTSIQAEIDAASP